MSASRSVPLTLVLLSILVVGGSMALVGSGNHATATSQDTAYLRVVHASPDAPAVDVYVGNGSEPTLANVSFGDVSSYLAVPAGTYNVTITLAGDRNATVYNTSLTLAPRTATTVAASGEVSTDSAMPFAPQAFNDDAFTPDANNSTLRIVHLSPDAPTVDVTAGNGSVVLAENVSFGGASDYVTVPAGNYTVEIRNDTVGANGTVLATVNVSLQGGTAYSAWALGYADPTSAPADTPFTVALTEDASWQIHLPETPTAVGTAMGTATGTATGTVTAIPTSSPTAIPSASPTAVPTSSPTVVPTASPTPTNVTATTTG